MATDEQFRFSRETYDALDVLRGIDMHAESVFRALDSVVGDTTAMQDVYGRGLARFDAVMREYGGPAPAELPKEAMFEFPEAEGGM